MKTIIAIMIMATMFACNKSEVKPAEPDPPSCQTVKTVFAGKYYTDYGDTIEIRFLHNNCPDVNSNDYQLFNFAHVANKSIPEGNNKLDEKINYYAVSNEVGGGGAGGSMYLKNDAVYKFARNADNGQINVEAIGKMPNMIQFYKVK